VGQCRQSELPVEAEVFESLDKVRFFVLFFFFFFYHCIVLQKSAE